MHLPSARQDKLVRATDIDALSCRFWANKKGYFAQNDRFLAPLVDAYHKNLPNCEGYSAISAERTLRAAFGTPKFPLINRGTYLRTHALDIVVELFVQEHGGTCQLVSLGGGSDTRAFRVLEKHPHVKYTEVDFPESARIKRHAVLNLTELQQALGYSGPTSATVQSNEGLLNEPLHFATDRYTLVGFDLRHIAVRGTDVFLFLEKHVPTLVISECVLCYLEPLDVEAVVRFWKSHLQHVALAIFDPMSLGDAFGESMTHNLINRGIDLQTFRAHPTLELRQRLLERELGFSAYLTDMAAVGGFLGDCAMTWLSDAESARVARLEMMDEVEEITLMLRHYSLIYAEHNMALAFAARLPWLLLPKKSAEKNERISGCVL